MDEACGDQRSDARADELLAVHSALEKLTAVDPRKSKVFELRYFGGLSLEETAVLIGVSPRTVKRDWTQARAWLYGEISAGRREHEATRL